MFTKGRIIFTIVFIVIFIIGMVWAYRKDLKQIKKWLPKPGIVLFSVLIILFIYVVFSKLV